MNPDQVQESADLSPSADETAAAAEAARQLHESTQTGKNKKLSPSAIKRPRDKSRHGRPLSTIESSSSASGSEMGDADSERDGSDTEENATGEPATPTASQDADGSSAEESEEHTTDATAAEGDETITTAPVSVDEALSSDAEPSHMRPESERTRIRGHGIHRRSVADLQQQVYALFDKFVPANSSQASGDVDPEARTIVSRELPALLDEFERQRGTPLIEPEMKPQLDAFAQANPDVIIPPAMLVQVISGLQEALNAGNVDANGSPQRDILSDVNRWSSTEDETSSGSSHSSPPPSPTPTQRRSFPRSGTLPELASSSNDLTFPSRNMSVSESPEHAFPRSTSDYSNLGGGTGIAPRQKTTSDPSSPLSSRRQSAPLGQPANSDSADRQRRDSHRERRVSGENKDVLSGKGRVRAPPSAWSRPKPQALASRSRRISDTDADSAAKNDDDDQPTSASARPERRRQSSQPINPSSPTGWFGPGGDAPSFPRSVSSSAFVFPRAISPNSPQDDSFHGYSARNADWNAVSGHGGPGSGSSRAGSPGLDETSFQPFRSLSAQALAAGGEGGSTRESASGHKPRADPSDWVDSPIRSSSDQLVVLQRKYDSLQRTLVERERALDRISEMQDEAMNDLQAKLEEAKAELGLRTKEAKDAKAAEKDYLDLISRHDTEMTKLQDELDQQMAITQKSRKENDKLTAQNDKYRNSLREKDERIATHEDHFTEAVKGFEKWEQDRQKYENAIEELQNRLANTEKAAEMAEGLQRDNTELQERANQLQFELETARRPGSGFLEQRAGSLPGSISKSLGTELAQHLREKEEEPISEGEETEEEGEAEDMSVDSFEETIIRRRKKRSGERAAPVELISASTQTDEIKVEHASTQSDPEEEAQAVPSASADLPKEEEKATEIIEVLRPEPGLPTYDEAAHEKAVLARTHPILEETSSSADQLNSEAEPIKGITALLDAIIGVDENTVESERVDYEALSKNLGVRCTVLEQAVEQRRKSETTGAVRRRPRRAARARVAQALHDGAAPYAQTFVNFLPHSTQPFMAGLLGIGPGGPHDSTKFVILSTAVVFMSGMIAGGWLLPGSRHYYYSPGLEDARAWQISNNLGLGFVGPGFDYPAGNEGGFFQRLIFSSVNHARRFPT